MLQQHQAANLMQALMIQRRRTSLCRTKMLMKRPRRGTASKPRPTRRTKKCSSVRYLFLAAIPLLNKQMCVSLQSSSLSDILLRRLHRKRSPAVAKMHLMAMRIPMSGFQTSHAPRQGHPAPKLEIFWARSSSRRSCGRSKSTMRSDSSRRANRLMSRRIRLLRWASSSAVRQQG